MWGWRRSRGNPVVGVVLAVAVWVAIGDDHRVGVEGRGRTSRDSRGCRALSWRTKRASVTAASRFGRPRAATRSPPRSLGRDIYDATVHSRHSRQRVAVISVAFYRAHTVNDPGRDESRRHRRRVLHLHGAVARGRSRHVRPGR